MLEIKMSAKNKIFQHKDWKIKNNKVQQKVELKYNDIENRKEIRKQILMWKFTYIINGNSIKSEQRKERELKEK